MSESDNLPTGGTDTAHPLSLEDAANIDIFDPSQDTEETDQEQTSGTETGEAEETSSQEAEETEATAGDEETAEGDETGETDDTESEPAQEPTDDVHVTVDGEKLALSELKAGYMRQADYSRKTQGVAETRKSLEALSARVTNSVNVIADFLVKQIPPAPDQQLAFTKPAEYVQQKALHEAAAAQVQSILEQAGQVKDVVNTLDAEQRKELIDSENAKLAEAFPVTATKEGRKAFFDVAAKAAKDMGYSDEEIGQVVDHRMFALAHYAAIGMKAEKAREKAKAKVKDAPPVAPQKARPQGGDQASRRKNQEAMKRLARSGSIHDALAIDFD